MDSLREWGLTLTPKVHPPQDPRKQQITKSKEGGSPT